MGKTLQTMNFKTHSLMKNLVKINDECHVLKERMQIIVRENVELRISLDVMKKSSDETGEELRKVKIFHPPLAHRIKSYYGYRYLYSSLENICDLDRRINW